MRFWIRAFGPLAVIAGIGMGLPAPASPDKVIRLALQEGGAAAWQVATMTQMGSDARNGTTLMMREVADSKAGQVALQAGEVDLILSDFIWTSLRRNMGGDFTFVPHSLAMPDGKVKATLNFRHCNARALVAGSSQIISVQDMLKQVGVSQPRRCWAGCFPKS